MYIYTIGRSYSFVFMRMYHITSGIFRAFKQSRFQHYSNKNNANMITITLRHKIFNFSQTGLQC